MTEIDYKHCKEHPLADGNNCVPRAIAVATQTDYGEVHELCARNGRLPNKGMGRHTWLHLPRVLGRTLVRRPDLEQPTIVTLMRRVQKEPKQATFLVLVKGHVAAIRNQELQDWLDPSRHHRVQRVWQVVQGVTIGGAPVSIMKDAALTGKSLTPVPAYIEA